MKIKQAVIVRINRISFGNAKKRVGWDSSVGIANSYGLDGPRIESRCRRDFPHPFTPALAPTRWGWVVNVTPWPLYPQERDPVPIVQEAGWSPGPVWADVENLALTGIRSPDRPACRVAIPTALSWPTYYRCTNITIPKVEALTPVQFKTKYSGT